ncbi:hypothetical protein ZIOFF_018695 [Zingiber officinale]|uniref:BRISC and BRCA1-A complex member 1 n=1 Tax=Zingiber officinale TaxID=94328 RepID=A0A8J5HWY4_ZINOF|nr:hypothetical protein ZIOFF_018695 [Zingiber officinale]
MEGSPLAAAAPSRSTIPVSSPPPRYTLTPSRYYSEDVLFCVDVDVESKAEMAKGRSITRLDAIKQAICLFIHAKHTMNPDHRFALSILTQSVSWLLVVGRRRSPAVVTASRRPLPPVAVRHRWSPSAAAGRRTTIGGCRRRSPSAVAVRRRRSPSAAAGRRPPPPVAVRRRRSPSAAAGPKFSELGRSLNRDPPCHGSGLPFVQGSSEYYIASSFSGPKLFWTWTKSGSLSSRLR